MNSLTRRNLIQLASAAPALGQLPQAPPPIGGIRPRPSASITASPLSIGFETLDRKIFEPEKTYAHLAALGVKWARVQTGWARTERTRGDYDFGWLDEVVDSLRRIGVQPWFNLGYGNRLYTPGAPHESAVGWAPVHSAEARQAWIRYTQRIAEHFRDRVKHWEIWNEPNIPNFWQPEKPNPDHYFDLVRMTAPEIRRRVPGAVIVGGALTGMPQVLDYLERCCQLGLARYIDKLSYHPYRAVPESNYETQIRAFRALLARYRSGIALWQGENGCPSENNGAGALANLDWNEQRQAKWLLRRLLTDLRLDIELTSYFHTVDMVNYIWSSGQSGKTNFKGVLRGRDYTPKPSYFAFQSLCALFDANTRPSDFLVQVDQVSGGDSLSQHSIQTAGFLRDDRPLYAWWYPASLQQDFSPARITLRVWSPGGNRLSQPVLVDLLTAQVHGLERGKQNGGFWTFEDLPLLDYPLLVADRSVALT